MYRGVMYSDLSRELLSQRIFEVIESWPEPHRPVFIRSHYWGETAEKISASMDMTPAEVSLVLEQCDQMLRAALRPFREDTGVPDREVPNRFGIPPRHLYC